jgi:hypothetical protein
MATSCAHANQHPNPCVMCQDDPRSWGCCGFTASNRHGYDDLCRPCGTLADQIAKACSKPQPNPWPKHQPPQRGWGNPVQPPANAKGKGAPALVYAPPCPPAPKGKGTASDWTGPVAAPDPVPALLDAPPPSPQLDDPERIPNLLGRMEDLLKDLDQRCGEHGGLTAPPPPPGLDDDDAKRIQNLLGRIEDLLSDFQRCGENGGLKLQHLLSDFQLCSAQFQQTADLMAVRQTAQYPVATTYTTCSNCGLCTHATVIVAPGDQDFAATNAAAILTATNAALLNTAAATSGNDNAAASAAAAATSGDDNAAASGNDAADPAAEETSPSGSNDSGVLVVAAPTSASGSSTAEDAEAAGSISHPPQTASSSTL